MSVKIAGMEFDNVFYDAEADVLYLHVGEPPARLSTSTSRPRGTTSAGTRVANS